MLRKVFILAFVLLILYAFVRRRRAKAVSYLNKAGLPRGIRNNNPGNIRIGATEWKGKIPVTQNTDGSFEQFQDFAHGVRAMTKLLTGYIEKGFDTVMKITNRYAPAADNNQPLAYAETVAGRVGVGVNEKLSPDKATMRGLVQQMSRVENGGDYITDEIFNQAWNLI